MKTILLKLFPYDIAEYIYSIIINKYIEKNIIGKVYMIDLYFYKIDRSYSNDKTYNLLYELKDFINIYNMYKFVYSKKGIYIIDDYIIKNINNSCIKLLYHLDYQYDFQWKKDFKEKVLFIKNTSI